MQRHIQEAQNGALRRFFIRRYLRGENVDHAAEPHGEIFAHAADLRDPAARQIDGAVVQAGIPAQFKELPAWGMYIRHANGIHFKNVTFKALASDYRPAIVLDDVNGGTFEGMQYIEPNSEGKNQLFDYKSQNIEIK